MGFRRPRDPEKDRVVKKRTLALNLAPGLLYHRNLNVDIDLQHSMHASQVGGVDNNRMFIRTHYQMFSSALHLDMCSMFFFFSFRILSSKSVSGVIMW